MKRILLGVLLTIAACGTEAKPAPSCFQAFTHYYDGGCRLVVLATGQVAPVGQVISDCQAEAGQAPASCQDDLDEWLRCIDAVTPAMQCDCSQTQMALLRCD